MRLKTVTDFLKKTLKFLTAVQLLPNVSICVLVNMKLDTKNWKKSFLNRKRKLML